MKIKPCPFCGSDDLCVLELSDNSCVRCRKCYSYGPNGKDEENAIERWNSALRKEDDHMGRSCLNCKFYPCSNKTPGTLWCSNWEEKEDTKMEKSCRNCKYPKLGTKIKNKWYCTKALETIADEHSCKSWAPYNPFGDTHATACDNCQYEYLDNGEHYCGKAIGNLDYCCPGWEAKEPEPAPLNSSKSSSLDELCLAAVEKWGATAQIYKTIEELSELITALARYQNAYENSDDAILSAADNVREEREDVEIMLRQLDVIVLRSEKWRRNKYEHLQAIVKNKEE